ncbi:DTW domain-containing protein [Shewanella algae]|nr:tRNA-uridine aminocarboxypropyltransferase [Shewanella algae]MBO2586611.1 DTW domain-containing protein [Shewanella algae]MBO2620276.1 DTW domain-containing protein [Shewanella algae]MBO2628645.1 DTW domain-containing protein [Shewanella algae]MBO2687880.1 DTW domain-containing protein [Shewanella algae]MBO2696329.1 DTW domain-containing protein [Shewanella algae]
MPVKIILLTHERELNRASNTATLALNAYPTLCKRVLWARKAPDAWLMEHLSLGRTALLYPQTEENTSRTQAVNESPNLSQSPNQSPAQDATLLQDAAQEAAQKAALKLGKPLNSLVILDATWQEAGKMYRQSPYLQSLARVELQTEQDSAFRLRRNQRQGGLCTLECIAAVWQDLGGDYSIAARRLLSEFNQWQAEIRAPA